MALAASLGVALLLVVDPTMRYQSREKSCIHRSERVAPTPKIGADAGAELEQGLAADREERARRVARVKRGIERARGLERWGGRLLSFGGILFYLLFLLFPLAEFVLSLDLPTRSWGVAFGGVVAAIVGGGFLVFVAQRMETWLEHQARASSIDLWRLSDANAG